MSSTYVKQQHLGDQINYWRTKKGIRFGFVIWHVLSRQIYQQKEIRRWQSISTTCIWIKEEDYVTIVPALSGGIKDVLHDMGRVFSECLERERLIEITIVQMQKMVWMNSESSSRSSVETHATWRLNINCFLCLFLWSLLLIFRTSNIWFCVIVGYLIIAVLMTIIINYIF